MHKNETVKKLPPLSLYIHFPWCVKKCPYCDFNSHEQKNNTIPENLYIEALISDIKSSIPLIQERQIRSIFFGGGTPSLFSTVGLDKLMAKIQSLLPIYENAEITMETNPSTADQNRFKAFRNIGINRLSIGIQSFSDKKLIALGRSHNAHEAKSAIETAMKFYSNINLDLMYALPNQTAEEFHLDLTTALSYNIQHLSFYHLTIEPNTFFAFKRPNLPKDKTVDSMQKLLIKLTKEQGFSQYEVSAFAKTNHQCQHNRNYWTFGDYLGVGAGAHSKISVLDAKNKLTVTRESRWKHPKKYMDSLSNKHVIETRENVQNIDLPFEYMLNILRLNEGFFLKDFVKKTQLPVVTILPKIEEAIKKGLLTKKKEKIVTTKFGKRFLNDLQEMFLPDATGI